MIELSERNTTRREYDCNHAGYTSKPFASLVRFIDSCGVALLIKNDDTGYEVVHSWLVRGVSEEEARAVLESQQ